MDVNYGLPWNVLDSNFKGVGMTHLKPTLEELTEKHREAQRLLENVSAELTVISKAMKVLGMTPVISDIILNDLAEAYMLHNDVWCNCIPMRI